MTSLNLQAQSTDGKGRLGNIHFSDGPSSAGWCGMRSKGKLLPIRALEDTQGEFPQTMDRESQGGAWSWGLINDWLPSPEQCSKKGFSNQKNKSVAKLPELSR